MRDFMHSPVVTVEEMPQVDRVRELLRETSHGWGEKGGWGQCCGAKLIQRRSRASFQVRFLLWRRRHRDQRWSA